MCLLDHDILEVPVYIAVILTGVHLAVVGLDFTLKDIPFAGDDLFAGFLNRFGGSVRAEIRKPGDIDEALGEAARSSFRRSRCR